MLPLGHLPAPSLGPLPRGVQLGSGRTMPQRVPVVDPAPLCTSGPCRYIPIDVVRGVGAAKLDAKCKFKKEHESTLSEEKKKKALISYSIGN